jgi:hypothetical protein
MVGNYMHIECINLLDENVFQIPQIFCPIISLFLGQSTLVAEYFKNQSCNLSSKNVTLFLRVQLRAVTIFKMAN